jgi:hypothetical protein
MGMIMLGLISWAIVSSHDAERVILDRSEGQL